MFVVLFSNCYKKHIIILKISTSKCKRCSCNCSWNALNTTFYLPPNHLFHSPSFARSLPTLCFDRGNNIRKCALSPEDYTRICFDPLSVQYQIVSQFVCCSSQTTLSPHSFWIDYSNLMSATRRENYLNRTSGE